MRLFRLLAVVTAVAACLPGCKSRQVRVVASGSSTVFPITEGMAEEYGKEQPDVKITVGIAGTGGGFKRFCAGEIDISDASRPIHQTELATCEKTGVQFLELPVAYDGIAVVVHPSNDWVTEMTVAELKQLWEPAAQGKVKRWNQIRPSWPDKEIHLFGPGVDSGTYDYFTEAIVGKEHSSRGDYTAAVDPNVLASGVAADPLGLGFFGMAYFQENKDKLKVVPVAREAGQPAVAPSLETVRSGQYQPLSRPIFIYVALKSMERPEVANFVSFYFRAAPNLIAKLGYVPLPQKAYDLGKVRAEKRQPGTMFGGKSQVGVAIDQIMEQHSGATAPVAPPAPPAPAAPADPAAPAAPAPAPAPAAPAPATP